LEGIDDGHWAVPELIIRFLRAAHQLNRCSLPGSPALTPQQIRTLLFLVHHSGATLKELAEALSISETRASRLVEELVESGHVQRDRDIGDRRHVRLSVTPEARDHAQRLYLQRSQAVRAALAGSAPEDIEAFTHVFGRIVEEFEVIAGISPEQPAAI